MLFELKSKKWASITKSVSSKVGRTPKLHIPYRFSPLILPRIKYTPFAGTSWFSSSGIKFAVGKPSSTPRPDPCTTLALNPKTQPSSKEALLTKPFLINSRMCVLEIIIFSSLTGSTTWTSNFICHCRTIFQRVGSIYPS